MFSNNGYSNVNKYEVLSMRYMLTLCCLCLAFTFGCAEKKTEIAKVDEVKQIPITSESSEIKKLMRVFLKNQEEYRYGENKDLIRRILDLDPDCILAIAFDTWTPRDERVSVLKNALDRLDSVSELEAGIVKAAYFAVTERNYSAADEIIDDLIVNFPGYYQLMLISADYKGRNRNAEGMSNRYKEAKQINPDSFAAYFRLALMHFPTNVNWNSGITERKLPSHERDLNEAERLLMVAQKLEPTNPAPRLFMSHLYRTKGNLDQALAAVEEAAQLATDENSALKAELKAAGARTLVFLNDYDGARKAYEEAIDITESVSLKRDLLIQKASTHLFERNFDQAIKDLTDFKNYIKTSEQGSELFKLNNLRRAEWLKQRTFTFARNREGAEKSAKATDDYSEAIMDLSTESFNEEMLKIREYEEKVYSKLRRIWLSLRFSDFESARQQLALFKPLVVDGEPRWGLRNFHSASAYLKLMEGDAEGALESYSQITSEGLGRDVMTKYFFALAKKANGDLDGSKRFLEEITTNYSVTWQVGLVRNLALDQLAKW